MIDFDINQLEVKLNYLDSLTYDAIHNSEEEFFAIGSKLQGILIESGIVTDMSFKSAKIMSDGILSTGIKELETLLQQFNDYVQKFALEIKNDREEFLKILANIQNIYSELDEFKKIIKQLKMLGVSTKIESSRLGGDDHGFSSLADNVEKLSFIIGEKTSSIKNQSSFLIKEIVGITSTLNEVEIVQNGQADLIIHNTSDTLAAFQKKNGQCSTIMSEIVSSSKNISKSISEIVSSIQFHDITRQQIEHVNEVIASMNEGCKRIKMSSEEHAIVELCILRDTSELQSTQINYANEELYNAVTSILSSLRGVEKSVSEMLSLSNSLFFEHGGSRNYSFKTMKNELLIIMNGLIKNVTIGVELAASIKSAVNVIDELSVSNSEIEEIGSEIELIALNARVRSARTGTDGSALGVIAEAIQKLSFVAKKQTMQASGILSDINDATNRLRINTSQEKRKTNIEELSLFSDKIKNMLIKLFEMENQEMEFLEKIKTNVYKLRNEIGHTLNEINIHEKVKIISQQIVSLFDEVVAQIELFPNVVANKKYSTNSIKKIYTMHSERKIHENFINGKSSSINKMTIINTENESEFGDNVELF